MLWDNVNMVLLACPAVIYSSWDNGVPPFFLEVLPSPPPPPLLSVSEGEMSGVDHILVACIDQ